MKILVANSFKNKNKPIRSLLKACEPAFDFLIRASDDFFVKSFTNGKRAYFGPATDSWTEPLFFLFAIISWPFFFFWLFFLKINAKIGTLICVNTNEKLLLTLWARLLGLKVIWLELPEKKYKSIFPSTWFLCLFSRLAKMAFFTSLSMEERIKSGFCKKNQNYLSSGPDLEYALQENLFSELAVSDKPYRFFKNFAIGTVVDFSDRGHFETLLRAIKNCSNIIPNIQLVIIGASAERRNLNWLSKKLGIEKKVWFVGEQENLIKWFDSFDLYFSLSANPNLFDLETMLLAMSRGVPAAVFKHGSFRDFISDGDSGFVAEAGNAESLASKLIDIEPNKNLLKKVGSTGQASVLQIFNRRHQAEELIKMIK